MGKKYPGVRPRGNSIQIDFRYKNVRCRETLRIPPSGKNLKLASNKLGEIQFEIALNIFDYGKHFPNSKRIIKFGGKGKSRMTISEAMDWWFKTSKHILRTKTIAGYNYDIENHVKPGIGETLITEVTSKQIKNWANLLPVANKTKNTIMIPLRRMFEEAFDEELISTNPMNRVKSFKAKRNEPSPLTTPEIDQLLHFLDGAELYFYQFAIWTGLSAGEQCGLKWEDINMEAKHFFVCRAYTDGRIEQTKNSLRLRKVELLQPAYDALQKLKKITGKQEWVFLNPRTNGLWKNTAISDAWRRALIRAELKYRHPYQTRHTFASLMLSAGLPLTWLREQMGHANYKMLEERYARWHHDDHNVVKWVLGKTQNGHNGPQFSQFLFK